MKRALESVNEKILASVRQRQANLADQSSIPRLIAVSKLKPISSIIEAYECGQRYFGENYIQELVEKSNSPEILSQCPEIKFHFIGHLQSNKVNKIIQVRNLHMIETIDSIKLANLVNKALDKSSQSDHESTDSGERLSAELERRLKVLIQVNTSGEEQKNGVEPSKVIELAEHITQRCPHLNLAGVMTIGKLDGWPEGEPNKDFSTLYEVREAISKSLSISQNALELSMGMSSDFEEAIRLGSTNVRVGTMIFGERAPR